MYSKASGPMPLPVLICDDSAMARKVMARSLPGDWDIDVSFACDGREAISAIEAGRADLLFLDLNMPVMDGYEVLQTIRQRDLPTMAIVVSGDVQQAAYDQVMALGALDFIKKPANSTKIADILQRYGIVEKPQPPSERIVDSVADTPTLAVALQDLMQEVVNIAMGEAGASLSKLLNTFVKLPVPKVMSCRYDELHRHIAAANYTTLSGVTEGFIGNNITGEAILLIDEQSFGRLFKLFDYDQRLRKVSDLEVLVDLSSVITGACLQSIGTQLDLQLSYSAPVMLGRQQNASELLNNANKAQQVLAIEVNYAIPDQSIDCDLLIVFTEQSIAELEDRAGCHQ
ncbi:response regulator [Aliidiomarina soli]